VKDSIDRRSVFDRNKAAILDVASFDSDYAGDLDRKRSILVYIFTMGAGTIPRKASLKSITALSTTEVEYVAATEGLKEAT